MLVRVYRNLHLKTYSVQAKGARGWRLAFHSDTVALTGVTFKVYEHGRQKVLKTRRKAVHAFVIGTLDSPSDGLYNTTVKISYNPYAFGHFYKSADLSPIYSADYVCLTPTGVFCP